MAQALSSDILKIIFSLSDAFPMNSGNQRRIGSGLGQVVRRVNNAIQRINHCSQTRSQGLSSYRMGRARRDPLSSLAPGGKIRDLGNEVALFSGCAHKINHAIDSIVIFPVDSVICLLNNMGECRKIPSLVEIFRENNNSERTAQAVK